MALSFFSRSLICILVSLGPSVSFSQIVINEYLSSNTLGLLDEHGETSDWLEIFNKGAEPVDLYHYGLSDDPADPFQWYFPSTLINPGAFVLVFASGESDRQAPYAWDALVTRGDSWRYRVNTSAPPVGWQELSFDDSSWPSGPSGFGYGDGDDQTVTKPCISVSLRLVFTAEDVDLVRYLLFHIDYDDGYVAWLNGSPISRGNIAGTGDPAWDCPADDEREAGLYRGSNLSGGNISDNALLDGENVLAVQVHNESLDSDDLTCIPYLTAGLRPFEGMGGRQPAPEVVAKLTQLHTGFKLSVSGEILTLVDPEGVVLDQLDTGAMYSDVSRGRYPDGAEDWVFLSAPSPRMPNPDGGSNAFSSPVFFSRSGGLLDGPATVALLNSDPAATIHYSTDGSIPDPTDPIYDEPLEITGTMVLRAVACSSGMLPSRPSTASYIIDEFSPLPTVSFVTEPDNLWDPETGIYVEENIFQEWERPVHLEFFETDGSLALNQDAGIKLFGAYSRTRPQKSFRLISRSGYGVEGFAHPILPEKDFDNFSQLVWRNAGNDNQSTHLRDGLMHRLVADSGLDHLAYRPSRVYLNGEYWGILNIRERIDEDYIAANHGLEPDRIDLIKNFWTTTAGSSSDFWDMWHYIEDFDLAEDEHFNQVASQMDVDNYSDYLITQIFACNHDFGTNNIAWWRSQLPGGKWRWILYDTEAGLGLQTPVEEDSLERALLESGSGWPSPTFRSHILRNLVRNDTFRASFINRFCDHLNTTFATQRTIKKIAELASVIAPEIPRHLTRWDRSLEWGMRVAVVYDFLERRPALCRGFLQNNFDLGEEVVFELSVQPRGAGQVQLAAAVVDSAFSGIYFAGVPLELTVGTRPGYTFVGWSDSTLAAAGSVAFTMTGNYSLVANFEETPELPTVVINEINYNSSNVFDPGDWVELHNPGSTTVELGGWVFRDGDDLHGFTIPDGVTLASGGNLVLCSDLAAFQDLFPGSNPAMGDLGFGFSGSGESLRLYDSFGFLQDIVTYHDSIPWPVQADGLGATLMLRDPLLDNALPENWEAGLQGGTPGSPNHSASGAMGSESLTSLDPPFPNPCNPQTEIAFSLKREQVVDLSVYDLRGCQIRCLSQGTLQPGTYTHPWDGTDEYGRAMPSGTYVFRLKLEKATLTRKTMLLR